MHSLSFQCSTVALIVLFQDIYCNPPLWCRNAAALRQAYKSIWVCRARWTMLGKAATHGNDATSEQHARRRPRRRRRRQPSPQETVGRQSLPLARPARSSASPLWTSSSRWLSPQKTPIAATFHAEHSLVGVGIAGAQNSAAGKYIE
jgi:hypothetical protein